MAPPTGPGPATGQDRGNAAGLRPLHVYTAGFFQPRIRRILALAGWRVTTGWPGPAGTVAVWGATPRAQRGERVAACSGAAILRVEDAWFRSLFPGRRGEPPLGLTLDASTAHYDPTRPSDLEIRLNTAPLDDPARLARAEATLARIARDGLTKYAATDRDADLPPPGYVLVIDQTRGDAALLMAGVRQFRQMLEVARDENPGVPLVIKTHPETARGLRPGHYTPADAAHFGATLLDAPVCPWRLLEGARAVYTFSSQLGLEAIFAGHTPRVLGQPFYAGWGLTEDDVPAPTRTRRLTRAQLALGALLDYPLWYDPFRDRLCEIDTVLDTLAAQARAWREDRRGYTAAGMRLWKRPALRRFYGGHGPLRFAEGAAAAADARARNRPLMVWAGKLESVHLAAPQVLRVEDGFLRSRGLGAALVPPLSLVRDDLGIYYDPTGPSRLEELIACPLAPDQVARTKALLDRLRATGVSKYNIGDPTLPELPAGHRILIPGQVENDASIRLGCTGAARTNRDLLQTARSAHPEAVLIYKPHPDVLAGLRDGAVPDAGQIADAVLGDVASAPLLGAVDAVWTLTSLMGFEALIRGVPVTCLGMPFYAGWGVTDDRVEAPERRKAFCGKMYKTLSEGGQIVQIAHGALIAYPRYHDPVTGRPCPPEVVIDRLSQAGALPRDTPNRLLSRLQGLAASQSWLWRR